MSLKIRRTPELKGKEADKFLEQIEENRSKGLSKKEKRNLIQTFKILLKMKMERDDLFF